MTWDDPSPRMRGQPATSRTPLRPDLQPGYGKAPVSFGRLVFRAALAAISGLLALTIAKAGIGAWHGNASHAAGLDAVLAIAVGLVVAALAWRYLANRPTSHGLSARIRDRGGWSWDNGPSNMMDNLMAADAVGDLVEIVIDVATDL